MIPVAQLDPASLALWVNYEVLEKSPNFKHYRDVISAAASGDLTAVEGVLVGIPTHRTRIRALHLASMIWHEQRHFLDLTVTNYGARHLRSNFTVALNVFPLVADQAEVPGSELLLPIERYRTLPSGLRPAHIAPSLLAQATDIRKRRTFLRADAATLVTPKGPAKISGEGVLEALGFLHQHWSVAHVTAGKSSLEVLRDVPERLQRNMAYEWPALIAAYLEMAPPDELAYYPVIPGARLLSAMLLAALCPGYLDPRASVLGVTGRFAFLIEKIRTGLARDLYASSFADCWNAVSEICKGEWDRTPEEEIATEIELEEGLCTRLVKRKEDIGGDVAADFFVQYHANRVRALQELQTDVSFLDPTAGPENRALPIPVYAIPNARPEAVMPGHFSLIGLAKPDEVTPSRRPETLPFTWAFAPESWPPEGTVIGFRPDESWREMLSLHIPAAKLMLNGLRHRAMLGPELANARETLEQMIRVTIDPTWDYSPVEETDLDQFLFLAETRSLPCDICDRSVSIENGSLVSPTELRSDPASVRVAERVYARKLAEGSDDERADIAALIVGVDWSHWLLCDVCVDWLRPQRATARSLAEEYLSGSESLVNDPEFAAAGVLGRAFVAQKQGLFPEAVALYQKALDAGDPQVSPIAAFSIGVLREAMGEPTEAVKAYVVAADPEWPQPSAKAAFNLGNLLKRADRIAGAATAYGMAAGGADEEVTAVAYLARARCLASLKDFAEALSSFRKVLDTTDDPVCHQEAWLGIGQAYADEGRVREAIEALDKAMAGHDDDLAAGAAMIVVMYAATWHDPEAVNRAKAVITARAGADLLEKLTQTDEAEVEAG